MKSISLYITRYLGVLLQIIATILILKKLDIENYGMYSLLINLLNWQIVFSDLGFTKHALRTYSSNRYINSNVIISRLIPQVFVIIITSFLIIYFYKSSDINIVKQVSSIALLTLLYTFFSKAIQGIKTKDFSAIFFESLLYPLIFTTLLFKDFSYIEYPEQIINLMLIARFASFLIILYFLSRKKLLKLFKFNITRVFTDGIDILRESKYLYIVEVCSKAFVLLPIFFYGFYLSKSEIAVVGFAEKLGLLSTTFLSTVNFIIVPSYRRYFKEGNLIGIKKLYQKSTRFLSMIMLPAFLIIILLLPNLIVLINDAYLDWISTIHVYLLAHLINVIFGSVGWLLIMTNNEVTVVRSNLLSIVAFIILGYVLVKSPINAAISFLVMTSIQNILNFIKVYSILYEKKINLRRRNA